MRGKWGSEGLGEKLEEPPNGLDMAIFHGRQDVQMGCLRR